MFAPVQHGFVARRPSGPQGREIAVGPRCIGLPGGEVLCSFMLTSGLGTNDFLPVLCRSQDYGVTWSDIDPIWPDLQEQWSFFVSLSRDISGNLFLCGSRSPIDVPGEKFWSDSTQGIKQNELVWAESADRGHTWSDPRPIPLPIPGSAEAPAPLCVTRTGRWLVPYSPYNTVDPALAVDRSQVIAVYSDDRGAIWQHSSMLRFPNTDSGGAEAWLTELTDGRLLGTGWHLNLAGGGDYPNAFAISEDNGETWNCTQSTGIMGQSTALTPWTAGRALFIYNQRKHGEVGVWLAAVNPGKTEFGIVANEIIWKAEAATRHGSSGEHDAWEDFSFGEPSITVLSDGSLLATIWCTESSGSGIRFVKLKLNI